jgi:hypothetical protein
MNFWELQHQNGVIIEALWTLIFVLGKHQVRSSIVIFITNKYIETPIYPYCMCVNSKTVQYMYLVFP